VNPTIAIDMDEVLFPLSAELIRRHNAQFATRYTTNDFVTYAPSDVWGMTYAESVERVYAFLREDLSDVSPVDGAVRAVGDLQQDYELVVITSRDRQLQRHTQRWIDAHFAGVFSDVVFAGNPHTGLPHEAKGDLCKKLNATWIVDDSLEFVADCSAAGIRAILFGDYPWNQIAEPATGVHRAAGWPEVVELLLPPTNDA